MVEYLCPWITLFLSKQLGLQMLCKSWCLHTAAKRNSGLPLHPFPILTLCLSSPLVLPTHCFSLTLTPRRHLLPSGAAGRIPGSPPSLPAFLAQVCGGASLLCSSLNAPSRRDDRESAYQQACFPPRFHLSRYERGKISVWCTSKLTNSRGCRGEALPNMQSPWARRVSTALLSCAGQDWGKATAKMWPRNWVSLVDFPLAPRSSWILLWRLCLACLNGGENKGKPQRENYTEIRLM